MTKSCYYLYLIAVAISTCASSAFAQETNPRVTDSPPLLMIQGDKDTTIPVKHAYHMKQKAGAVRSRDHLQLELLL
jgi:hypothetical protein